MAEMKFWGRVLLYKMMSDKDNDKTPNKQDSPPTPEEMQETLKDFFSKKGGKGVSF